MNYWVGCGLLIAAAGLLSYIPHRRSGLRVRDREGYAGASALLGYTLPVMGAFFMLIGLLQMAI